MTEEMKLQALKENSMFLEISFKPAAESAKLENVCEMYLSYKI